MVQCVTDGEEEGVRGEGELPDFSDIRLYAGSVGSE